MAVKKIPITDQAMAIAMKEIGTVVKLQHTNIINYYHREIDQKHQNVYLGLGYCEGTLKDVIDSAMDQKFEFLLRDPAKKELV